MSGNISGTVNISNGAIHIDEQDMSSQLAFYKHLLKQEQKTVQDMKNCLDFERNRRKKDIQDLTDLSDNKNQFIRSFQQKCRDLSDNVEMVETQLADANMTLLLREAEVSAYKVMLNQSQDNLAQATDRLQLRETEIAAYKRFMQVRDDQVEQLNNLLNEAIGQVDFYKKLAETNNKLAVYNIQSITEDLKLIGSRFPAKAKKPVRVHSLKLKEVSINGKKSNCLSVPLPKLKSVGKKGFFVAVSKM